MLSVEEYRQFTEAQWQDELRRWANNPPKPHFIVRIRAQQYRVARRRGGNRVLNYDAILSDLAQGMTMREVANIHGCSRQAVNAIKQASQRL